MKIDEYKKNLDAIPLCIHCTNFLELFTMLKREEVGHGPYPNVSLFEATNRIMSDLVILVGIRNLLNGSIGSIDFSEYTVDLGNDNTQGHDIMAEQNGKKLIGEAFNVDFSPAGRHD